MSGALLATTAILVAAPIVLPSFFVLLLSETAILALFATALNFLLGFGGMAPFGQAAYFALGAYAAAFLSTREGAPMLVAMAAAPLVATAGALVFGFFIVRLTAAYFAMLSLACGQIVYIAIVKWSWVTGGYNGLLNVWPAALLKAPTAYYYFTIAVVGSSILVLHAVVSSPFGYALRAIRDDPRRARFIGVSVRRHQLAAFAMAGFFSGLAGALHAFFNGSVFPDSADFYRSFEPMVVVLLGGAQGFFGPLFGAVLFKALGTFVGKQWLDAWPLVMGLVLAGVLFFLPGGVVGLLEATWWRRWRARAS